MPGAIIGDRVESRFKFNNNRSKECELFTEGCFATDDSIMNLAVAKVIMEVMSEKELSNSLDSPEFRALIFDLTVKKMQEIGQQYPDCGFGGGLTGGYSVAIRSHIIALVIERPWG